MRLLAADGDSPNVQRVVITSSVAAVMSTDTKPTPYT
jgi:hypothetical protein